MFKWLSIITGVLAVAGTIALGVGAAPVTIAIIIVIAVLGVIAAASGTTHLVQNNEPTTSPTISLSGNNSQPDRINSLSAQRNTNTKQADAAAAEAILALAQSHQLGKNGHVKNLNEAFHCYIKAAKSGHPDALSPLERIGDDMSAEKQLELSKLYGTFFNNQERAEYWRNKASEIADFKFNI